MKDPSLPTVQQLELQSLWLKGARNRLYKQAALIQRVRILDLGSGRGHITAELARRCPGMVVALDRSELALHESVYPLRAFRVVGNSGELPFATGAFDLVFTQNALMWMRPLPDVISEIGRIVETDGWLIALEPDYGGYIEHPPHIALKDVWLTALIRAGAVPEVGRLLPDLLERAGFQVYVYLFDRFEQSGTDRLGLIGDLPLTPEEQLRLERAATQLVNMKGWQQLAHLPYFMIAAKRC